MIRQTSPGTYIGELAGVVLADPDVQSLSRGTDTGTVEGNAQARGAFASIKPCSVPRSVLRLRCSTTTSSSQTRVSAPAVGPRTYGRRNVITGQPMRINGVSYYYLRAVALASTEYLPACIASWLRRAPNVLPANSTLAGAGEYFNNTAEPRHWRRALGTRPATLGGGRWE